MYLLLQQYCMQAVTPKYVEHMSKWKSSMFCSLQGFQSTIPEILKAGDDLGMVIRQVCNLIHFRHAQVLDVLGALLLQL